MDSSALIPELAFGGNNEAAGIVTQLAIAEALGKLKRDVSLINAPSFTEAYYWSMQLLLLCTCTLYDCLCMYNLTVMYCTSMNRNDMRFCVILCYYLS